MENSVTYTIEAIKSNKKVCIFADYNVDGTTSSALLLNIFRQLNVDVDVYVPDHLKEGHGPTPQSMEVIHKKEISLLLTVNCGSVAFDALVAAANLGMNVVVIDNNKTLEILPNAVVIINHSCLDSECSSEYNNLNAVGISFLFIIALLTRLTEIGYFQKKMIPLPNVVKQLDLVALGTVCSFSRLTGLNR